MKTKRHLKFIFLFLCLLGIYIFLITHIELLIVDYDNYFANYTNRYDTETTQDDTIGNIFDTSVIEQARLEDIDAIKNDDLLLSMLSHLYGVPKGEITKSLEEYGKIKMVNLLKNNSYPHVIYYVPIGNITADSSNYSEFVENETSSIMFTLTIEDFYYRSYTNGNCQTNSEVDFKKSDNTIDTVIKNVRDHLDEMGLLAKYDFEFSSIRNTWLKEYRVNDGENHYYIEDYKNSIKIEYNLVCNSIDSIQIGFTK